MSLASTHHVTPPAATGTARRQIAAAGFLATTAISGALSFLAPAVLAQTVPNGGAVVAGQATISQRGATGLVINQLSDRAVLTWKSFSIDAASRVDINQPGTGSVSVQQVTGSDPSNIFGALISNGRVVIANPNGIWFGPGAHVDVAGIVATTARLSDSSVAGFMAGGGLDFDVAGHSDAGILNAGSVTIADSGLAAFVAPGVANSGMIAARLGRVSLASGNRFTLDLNGDGLVSLAVNDKVLAQAIGPDGRPLAAAVSNVGQISADGGKIYISANVAKGIVDNVIDMTGVVQARGVSHDGGDIVLSGGEDGTVSVTGRIDASSADRTGGTAKVLGNTIAIRNGAAIDVSGASGGGTALIGGNLHGVGPEPNAQQTTVAAGATISANAVTTGDGGNVAIWSDRNTTFNGTASARGGAQSGKGGVVETSSPGVLDVSGARIDTRATDGTAGTWLLDPTNVTISTDPTNGESAGPTYTPTAPGANISAADIRNNFATSNVVVNTSPDNGESGDITIGAAITVGSGTARTLTLTAAGAISGSANIGASGDALTVIFNQGGNGTYAGVITGTGGVTKQGAGTLTLTGTNTYTGITTVTAGTLKVGAINNGGIAGNLGQASAAATNLVLNGGTLEYSGAGETTNRVFTLGAGTTSTIQVDANALTLPGATGTAGTGALTKAGAGTLTLSAANTYTGLTTIAGGTLAYGVTNNLSSGAVTVNGGTLDLGVNHTDTVGVVTLISGAITGTGTSALTGSSYAVQSGTISAVLAGTGALTKSTSGTVTLSAANTYSGTTTVSAGRLVWGASNVIASGAVTVNGGTLDLGAFSDSVGTVTLQGGGSITGSGSLTSSAAFALQSGSVSAVLAGAVGVNKTTTGTVTLSGSNTYTGTTSITAGTLSVSAIGASGSFGNLGTGGITLGAGTLQFTGASDATDRSIVLTNSAASIIDVASGSALTISGVISGGNTGSSLTKSGAGTLALSAANSYTGTTTVTGGTLLFGASNVLVGNVTVNGGTLDLGVDHSGTVGTVTLTNGSITGTGSSTLTGTSYVMQNGSVSAILAGSVGLTKSTTGTVTLSGQNTYNGVTTISAGTLSVRAIGASGVPGNLGTGSILLGAGTLRFTGASDTTDRSISLTNSAASIIDVADGSTLTIAGTIANGNTSSSVTKTGAGILTLSGTNTYGGITNVSAGTLLYGASNVLVGAVTVNGGKLDLGDSHTDAVGVVTLTSGTITGSGTSALTGSSYAVQSGTISAVLAGTGALIKSTTGTVTLSAANTYSGTTTISAGTLAFGASNVIAGGAVTVNGGTLDLGAFSDSVGTVTLQSTGSIIGSGSLTSSAAFALQSGTVSAVLAGTLGVNKTTTGTVTLSGTNTYTGVTSVTGGILSVSAIGASGSPGNLGTGTITLGAGTLQFTGASDTTNRSIALTSSAASIIDVASGSALTISSVIAGGNTSSSLTKAGTGTLTLSGTNTYTGTTNVAGGTLLYGASNVLVGAVTVNGGTLDLGLNHSDTVGTVTLTSGSIVGTGTSTLTGTSYAMQSGSVSAILGGSIGLTKSGTGTVTLSGQNTYTGVTTISGGTLSVSAIGANGSVGNIGKGSISLGAGSLQFTGVSDTTDRGISLTNGAASTIDVADGSTLTIAGIIASGNTSSSVTKAGLGTLILTGANAYTGATTISGGLLQVGNGGTGGVLGTGAVTNNATLAFNRSGTVSLSTLVPNTGAISGTGSVTAQIGGGFTVDRAIALTGSASAVSLQSGGAFNLNSAISTTGASDLVLISGGTFTNSAGSSGLSAGTGRWLVYLPNLNGNTFGALDSSNTAVWNTVGGAAVSQSGNRYVFAYRPTATITSTNVTKTYGEDATSRVAAAYTVPDLQPGVTGAYLGDTMSTAFSGTPTVTSTGSVRTQGVAGSPFAIIASTAGTTPLNGYALSANSAGSLSVTPASLSVRANDTSKTYGSALTFTGTEFSATGLQNGDTIGAVTLNSAGAAATATVGGTPYTITASGATAGTFNIANYSISYASGSLTVNPLAIVLTGSRAYNGAADIGVSDLAIANNIDGANLTVVGAGTLSSKNAGTRTINAISGSFSLAGSAAANYTTAGASSSITIGKATLVITARTDTKTYDHSTTSLLTPTVTGLQASDSVASLSQSFDSINAGGSGSRTLSVDGGYSISDGNAGNNYSVTLNTATGTISQRTVTLTGSRTYDGGANASASDLAIANNLDGANVTLTGTVALAGRNAAVQSITGFGSLALGGSAAGNYTLAGTTGSVTIGKAALSITAVTDSKTYNQSAASSLTPTVTGIQVGDNVTGLSQAYDTANAGSRTLSVTGYTVNDGNSGGNYALTLNTASGSISQRVVTLSGSRTYDGTTNAAAANLSVTNNLDGGSLVLGGSGTLASRNAGAETITGFGGFTLTGAAKDNYTLTGASGSMSIGRAPLTISAATQTRSYDHTTISSATPTISGLQAGDTVTGLAQSFDSMNASAAGGRTLSVSGYNIGDGNSGNNYTVALNTATGTINPLSVIFSGSRTYDGTTDASSADLVIANNFDGANLNLSGIGVLSGKNVGSRSLVGGGTLALGGSAASNYTIAGATGALTIDRAELMVASIVANDKVYNGDDTASADIAQSMLDGVFTGDTVTLNSAGYTAHFSDKNVGTNKTVTITGLSLSGADAGNYLLAGTSATALASISRKSLTLTSVAGVNKVYDGTTVAGLNVGSAAFTGLVAGDAVQLASGYTASFADKNVDVGKAVSISGLALTGTDGGNYQLTATAATSNANITAKTITAGVTAASKTYDGSTVASITGRGLTGAITGDTVSLTGGIAAFADKNAATNKAVTATGLSLTGADAGNYQLASTSAATVADILARSVTITGLGVNAKIYDGTTSATLNTAGLTFSGIVSGDTLTLGAGYSAAFADKNAATGKTVAVSGLSLSGADASNYALSGTTTTALANITQKTVSLTGVAGTAKVYDGTTAASLDASSAAFSGLITGDTVALGSGYTAAFTSKNAGAGRAINVTGLALGGADGANYQLSATTAVTTADITAKSLTVAGITANDKIYDGTTAATASTTGAVLTGVIGADAVTMSTVGFTAAFSDKNAGTAKTVNISGLSLAGTDATNYQLTAASATATATITSKAVTVSGVAVSNKIYDGGTAAQISAANATISGMIAGDTAALSTAGATGAFATKNVGVGKSVTIAGLALSGVDSANYQVTAPAGLTANISPLDLSLNLSAASKVYDGTTAAALSTALARGVAGGDRVTVTIGGAAFVDKNVGTGKTVTVSGIGLAGDDASNYSIDSSSTVAADITPATLGATIAAASKVYDGTVAAVLTSRGVTGVLGSDTVGLSGGTATFADKNAGTGKTVTATGFALNGADAGNYRLSGSSVTTTSDITPKSITVAGVSANNKVYDGTATATLNAAGAQVSGLVGGDSVGLNTSGYTATFADKNAGTAKTVTVSGLSLSGADARNYLLSGGTATTSAAITPASLTVAADNKSRVYGDANPALTATYSGLKGSDTAADIGGLSLTTTATTNSGIGTYAINGTGPASANYVIVYLPGTMTIARAPLTITADDKGKVSGEPLPPFTSTYAGFKLGEGPAVVSGLVLATSATGASPAGSYAITASGASAANYAITFVNGRLIVSPGAPPSETLTVGQQIQTPAPAAATFAAGSIAATVVTTNLGGGGGAGVAPSAAAGGAPANAAASAAAPAATGTAQVAVAVPGAPIVSALVTTSDVGVASFANGFLTGAMPLPPPPAPITPEAQ